MSTVDSTGPNRLHLGCGKKIIPEWINLDIVAGEGVDVVADLDRCADVPLPFEADSIDEFIGSHLLEHIRNVLPLMQELHRIAKPGAKAHFAMPYGSSDDAYEDPTHIRLYFINSFGYFSQPYYWRADYGYNGDWLTEHIILKVSKSRYQGREANDIYDEAMRLRNVVIEMTARLIAVKPIREPKKELQVAPSLEISLV
jgi:SAM-dependent methyltransferase